MKATASISRDLAVATGTAEGNSSGSSIGEVFRFEWFGAVAEGAEPVAGWFGEGVAAVHVQVGIDQR